MGRWATGVSVVTTRSGATDAGLTVNAFLSVSLAPPTVLVSLSREADTTPLLRASGTFAVNLLAADQESLSDRFARTIPPEEKFRDLSVARGETGAALIAGTLGAIEARVLREVVLGDHLLFLGEAVRVHFGRDSDPLVFFRRGYAHAEAAGWLRLPTTPAPPKG
ncbi:MAG: flavin reductase family protein [Thermoplasmata archaeon]